MTSLFPVGISIAIAYRKFTFVVSQVIVLLSVLIGDSAPAVFTKETLYLYLFIAALVVIPTPLFLGSLRLLVMLVVKNIHILLSPTNVDVGSVSTPQATGAEGRLSNPNGYSTK